MGEITGIDGMGSPLEGHEVMPHQADLSGRKAVSSSSYPPRPDFDDRPLKPMPSSRWGIGRFCLSESKCTVSARILHGFKTCRGCFSLQNPTKGAEIAG